MARFHFGKKKKTSDLNSTMPTKSTEQQDKRHSYLGRPSLQSQSTANLTADLEVIKREQTILPPPAPPLKANKHATTPWLRFRIQNSPFPRYRHAALSTASEMGDIFIMGGLKEGSVFGDTWRILPQVSDKNILTGFSPELIEVVNNSNPPARVGHSSVLCGNAYIVYGGDTVDSDANGFPDDNLYMFNINNRKYTIPSHLLNKPRGRYGHLLGVVSLSTSSSRLYLFGGQLENDVFNDLHYFELTSFKLQNAGWETVAPINNFKPPPLTNHSMLIFKHKIYIFGGVYNHEKVSRDLWCYDTLKNKWLQVLTTGDVPLPVNEHSAVLVGEKLYIYGGNDFSGTIYDTLYCLDLRTFQWKQLSERFSTNGPGPRCGHSMSFIPKLQKLVIMGGDKNDYIFDDQSDFGTYENYDGVHLGTMIYVLDIPLVDYFLRGGVPKKIAASAGGAAGVINRRAPSPLPSDDAFTRHRKSLSAGIEDYKTPNQSLERLSPLLDSQQRAHDIASSSDEAEPAPQFDIHTTEFVGDKFVDVFIPSSAMSIAESDNETAKIQNRIVSQDNDIVGNSVSRNDYSKPEGSRNSVTPVLSKDFAYSSSPVIEDFPQTAGSRQRAKLIVIASEKEMPGLYAFPSEEQEQFTATISDGVDESRTRHVAPTTKVDDSARSEQIIADLRAEIENLKISTKEEKKQDNQRIQDLEERNSLLERAFEEHSARGKEEELSMKLAEQTALVEALKISVNPQILEVPIRERHDHRVEETSETKKHRLSNIELSNKLLYLQSENEQYREKLERFEPFMSDQFTQLSSFHSLIKAHEDKIADLTSQLRLELVLRKEIFEWKHKYEDLEFEFETYRSLHAEVDHDAEDQDESRGIDSQGQRKSASTLSAELGKLLLLWQTSVPVVSSNDVRSTETSDITIGLQNQVDELLSTCREQQESSATEVKVLTDELDAKIEALNTLESKYRDAILSVNNTSKALNVNQEELQNQKLVIEKLSRENQDLKMQRKSRRVSSMALDSGILQPLASFKSLPPDNLSDDGEDNDLANAHYQMRVRDLEADIYIMKQERDQLSDTVNSLKKELYFSKQKAQS